MAIQMLFMIISLRWFSKNMHRWQWMLPLWTACGRGSTALKLRLMPFGPPSTVMRPWHWASFSVQLWLFQLWTSMTCQTVLNSKYLNNKVMWLAFGAELLQKGLASAAMVQKLMVLPIFNRIIPDYWTEFILMPDYGYGWAWLVMAGLAEGPPSFTR